jgi:hypothetical protein
MSTRSGDLKPSEMGLVLGTLFGAAAECMAAARHALEKEPELARSMTARARSLVEIAERFETGVQAEPDFALKA